jgi:hypothetical protein
MKNKSQYEKELEYQIQLMRAIDSQSAVRELAASLVEYGRLVTTGKLSSAGKDNLVREIGLLAAELEQDERHLESFKWIYVLEILKADLPSEATQAVRELCEARFPSLYDYLTVTLTEVREKLSELRGNSPDSTLSHDKR